MQCPQPYVKPSENALVELTAHLENAPPLADDSSSEYCLVGYFDVDGELASVRLHTVDDVEYTSERGVAVPITSRTETIDDLERTWNHSRMLRR